MLEVRQGVVDNSGSSDQESQTNGLIINVVIGTITTILSLILFEVFRRWMPSIFEARRTLHERRDPVDYHKNRIYSPPSPSYRPFGWIQSVYHLELETISQTHGLDTALFLRYLQVMTFVFCVLLIPTVPLLPVYYTGANKDSNSSDLRTIGIQKFSLSNLPLDDPWRFWVTLIADYVCVAFVLIVIYREFTVYAKYRMRYRASQNPANYAILVEDVPKGNCSESAVRHYWDRLLPGHVKLVHRIRDAQKIVDNKDKFWKAVTARERAEWDQAKKLDGERPTHKTGICSCLRGESARVDSINYWTERQQHYANKVSAYQQDPEPTYAPYTRSAVVVFEDRRAASAAAQINFANKEHEWRVERAPEPDAVNWKAFTIPGYQVGTRNFIAIVLAIALTLLWIFPISFIMGLTSLSSLANLQINGNTPFSFLSSVSDWSPGLTGFIESYLPAVILTLFLQLVPIFLRMIISISRVTSLADLDRQVRDWYFNFIIFSNFLFVIVTGSLLNELSSIVENPGKAPDFLASSAPNQGAFMMNFILIKALTEAPKEILQIGRVVVRWFKMRFLARTERQKEDAEVGNTQFTFLKYYAVSQLIALLGFIYSTISPFIIPCCLVYFVVMYFVWKYNLCFSHYNEYQDGGRMYGGALYGAWTGLFLHLITMIGIFGLNRNAPQSILIILPAVASLVFLRGCLLSFTRIIVHGSALESTKRVEENEGEDRVPDEMAEYYIHPGFEPLPDPIENKSGVQEKSFVHMDEADVEKGVGRGFDSDEDAGLNSRPVENYESTSAPNSRTKSGENWVDAFGGPEKDSPKKDPL